MPLQARCPKCTRLLTVPESLLGKPVRCPGCQFTFTLAAPASTAVTAVAPPPAPPKPAPPPAPPQPKQSAPPKPAEQAKPATTPDDFSWEPAAREPAPPPAQSVPKPVSVTRREDRPSKATAPDDFGADFGAHEESRPSRPWSADYFKPWKFNATVQRDPEKKLKGVLECQVTAEGLWLRQGEKFYTLLAVPSRVSYKAGNKLTVEIEGRDVEIAVTPFNLYQARVARELARFLSGEGPPPTQKESVIPQGLYALAFLPVGIPILTAGGAIWGGLAGLLIATCFAIIRRDQWPMAGRVALSVAVSVVGYLILFFVVIGTKGSKAPKGPEDSRPLVNNNPGERPPERRVEPRHGDAPQNGELRRLRTDGELVWQVRFHPSVQKMATLGKSGICELWETETGKLTGSFRVSNPGFVNWMTYSPLPGKYVVGWNGEQQVLLRDARTGDIMGRADLGRGADAYCTCEFFPDGNRMVVCGGGVISFFSVPDCKPLAGFDHIKPQRETSFYSACITPDGSTLLTGSKQASGRYDEVWDLTSPSPPRRLTSFSRTNHYARMTLAPKGDLAMISSTRFVELVDWKTDRLVLMKEAPVRANFSSAAISPLGNMLITGHPDSHVRFWDIPSGRELGKLKIGSTDQETITGVAVSPDDRFLTTARNEVVTIWETKEVYPR